MALSKAYVKYVEYELTNYRETKKELINLQADIIHRGKTFNEIKTQQPNNPTLQKAIHLSNNKRIREASRVIRAIDRALTINGNGFADIFKAYYLEGKSWQKAAMDTNLSQSAFFNQKRKLIEAVAVQMGLSNPN